MSLINKELIYRHLKMIPNGMLKCLPENLDFGYMTLVMNSYLNFDSSKFDPFSKTECIKLLDSFNVNMLFDWCNTKAPNKSNIDNFNFWQKIDEKQSSILRSEFYNFFNKEPFNLLDENTIFISGPEKRYKYFRKFL